MDDVTDKIQKKTRLNPDLIKFIATTKITAWAKCQASFFLALRHVVRECVEYFNRGGAEYLD
jgi:hypothetical protein